MKIPTGKLTILIGSRSRTEISHLMDLLWTGDDPCSAGDKITMQKGEIRIHGRNIKDWDVSTLRDKIVFMKDGEAHLPMKLGVQLVLVCINSIFCLNLVRS